MQGLINILIFYLGNLFCCAGKDDKGGQEFKALKTDVTLNQDCM